MIEKIGKKESKGINCCCRSDSTKSDNEERMRKLREVGGEDRRRDSKLKEKKKT